MNLVRKHNINLILLVLVYLVFFSPLLAAQSTYFTGYLDLEVKNKIKPELSFFIENNLKESIFYRVKYDSNPINSYAKIKNENYLDDSVLIRDLSKQKEYLQARYKRYNLLYGLFHYQVKTPLFSDYYNQFKGVKLSQQDKKSNLEAFISKTAEIPITDRILNPDYSVIFLSSRHLKYNSERVYVNIKNKENRLLKTTALRKEKDYTIDYLNGIVSFNPTIFFLNNPDYNYELAVGYKIKENRGRYLNKGYQYSTHILENTKLKLYDVSKEKRRDIKGVILQLSPDHKQKYTVEYQKLKEGESNTNLSINNGEDYKKDPTTKRAETRYGIKYRKKFKANTLLKGHSIKSLFNNKQSNYTEDEHRVSLSTKLNNHVAADFIYTNRVSDLNLNNYKYQVDINSRLSPKLKLNSTYRYEFDNLEQKEQTSLDNFFGVEFSENSYIYWGCLHNLTKEKNHAQYGIEYITAKNSKFAYKNKVIDTQYRKESYKYQREKGFELFKTVKKKLKSEQFVKKSEGIKYPINKKSSISVVSHEYNQKEINTSNIIKYSMQLNRRLNAEINYLRYELNPLNKKRSGLRALLNYVGDDSKYNIQYETVKNRSNRYQKSRYDLSYKKVIAPHTLILIASKNNNEDNKETNLKKRYSESLFKANYRPLNKNYNFRYKYLKERELKRSEVSLDKLNTTQHSLNLLYKLNSSIALDTNLQRYLIKQNIDNNFIKNQVQLNRFGLSYQFYKDYTFNLAYKTLYQKQPGIIDSGYLVGLKKSIKGGLTLALEYNFTDFKNKISQLDLKDKGLSLNLNYRW